MSEIQLSIVVACRNEAGHIQEFLDSLFDQDMKGMSWEAIQANHREWLDGHLIRILYAQGAHRIKDLPNDPALLDFATDERSRNILSLLGSGPDIGRSLVAAPNFAIPTSRNGSRISHTKG